VWPLLRGLNGDAATRAATLDFVARERTGLAARLNDTLLAALPRQLSGGCSEAEARHLADTFASQADAAPGGRLGLSRAVDTVRLCTAWATRQGSRLD
jgi:hypothetical protein